MVFICAFTCLCNCLCNCRWKSIVNTKKGNIRSLIVAMFIMAAFVLLPSKAQAQFSSVSVNALGWVTGNFNAAVDFKLDTKVSVDLPLSFSPVKGKTVGWQNVTFSPGVRFWATELYRGSFFGVYASGALYDLRYGGYDRRGWATGVGFSYGYSKLLSKRWNLELELGFSAVYAEFDRHETRDFGVFEDETWWRTLRLMLLTSRMKVSVGYLF